MYPKRPRVIRSRGQTFQYPLKNGKIQVFDSEMINRRLSDSQDVVEFRNIPHIQEREPESWTGLPPWKKRKLAIASHNAERARIKKVRKARKQVHIPSVRSQTGRWQYNLPRDATQVFPNDPDRVLSPGWRRWSLDAVRTDLWEGPVLRLPELFDNAYDGDESDNDGSAPLPGIDIAAIIQAAPKKRSSRRAHRWRSRVPSSISWRLQPAWRIISRVLKLSILVFCALLLPVLLLLLFVVGYLAYFAFTIWWSVFSVRHDIDPSSMSEKEVNDSVENWVQRNFDHYWYRFV